MSNRLLAQLIRAVAAIKVIAIIFIIASSGRFVAPLPNGQLSAPAKGFRSVTSVVRKLC